MTIKTFRGKIIDGGQDTIVLHTNDGSTGYRIVKFQIMTAAPGTVRAEHVVKIYKTLQTTVDGLIDMSNQTLLAAAEYAEDSGAYTAGPLVVIFDQEIFNQDIYVTHAEVNSSQAVNYYIELEQVKLDLNENTVATLKDIRNLS
jgi:hypothetical protein